jgi:glycolate oxidase
VLRRIQEIEQRHEIRIAKIFHAGDGNLHSNILYERGNEEEFHRAEAATEEIFRVCAEAGGTITGEHGVGAEKIQFMSLLYSPADMEAQRKVKSVFDPDELANPGKVLPAAESVGGGAR